MLPAQQAFEGEERQILYQIGLFSSVEEGKPEGKPSVIAGG
jgi:hypothetical protein